MMQTAHQYTPVDDAQDAPEQGATENTSSEELQRDFAPFAEKMRSVRMPEPVIDIFRHYYDQLVAGATGYIDSQEAGPVSGLPDYEEMGADYERAGIEALERSIVLKLNGGLGTSMGMSGPKSLLKVKDGLSFLDIVIRQVTHVRATTDVRLPLVLMNSFSTHKDTLQALQAYPDFDQDIPIDFLQHMMPKIWKESLTPAVWPRDPEKEWCPPGHGNIYIALATSGMLDEMLSAGYDYLFVSNSDNLGAVLDIKILGYFAAKQLPFLMEVAHRTVSDKKGGHLSRRPDGQLILRELAQCPPDEMESFQDIDRYRYFNTNNLWVHLPSLKAVLNEHEHVLGLPLIRNQKPVDPTDLSSPQVYQLETAMGSAISLFPRAEAMRVPRTRFVPVKRNNDLLLLWSDVYELAEDYTLRMARTHQKKPSSRPPLVTLDNDYYQMIDDLAKRFPGGAPSLLQCTEFHVEGDVHFGKDVVLEGAVRIINTDETPLYIADGAHITGEMSSSGLIAEESNSVGK